MRIVVICSSMSTSMSMEVWNVILFINCTYRSKIHRTIWQEIHTALLFYPMYNSLVASEMSHLMGLHDQYGQCQPLSLPILYQCHYHGRDIPVQRGNRIISSRVPVIYFRGQAEIILRMPPPILHAY